MGLIREKLIKIQEIIEFYQSEVICILVFRFIPLSIYLNFAC